LRKSTGKVKWFDNDKGSGVLTNQSGQDVYVHYSDIKSDGFKTLKPKQRVAYTEVKDENGLYATNVHPLDEKKVHITAHETAYIVTATKVLVLVLLILAALWYLWR